MSIGLIGLPPTPAEIDSFVEDASPDACSRLVDRLLASPHYGERWGRHWLDLARFAETDGFEHDAVRSHSWRYRDYVIASFNRDKPFDRFLQEQLAGDEMWPDSPDALIATGFNLLGPDMVDSSDQIQRRLNTLNDMTDTVASVCLGLTLGCARCHDHKFEPLTQKDYFSFQAFFEPSQFRREAPVPSREQQRIYDLQMHDYLVQTHPVREQIKKCEAPYRRKLFETKLSKLSEDAQSAHRTPRDQRTAEQEATVQETEPQVKVTDAEVLKALSSDDLAARKLLDIELNKIRKPEALPLAMILQNTNGPAVPTHVLARGDYGSPRERVDPAIPEVLHGVAKGFAFQSPTSQSRRSLLAEWVGSTENPLVSRVMMNRLWQHHFGRGLVSTPNDFGTQGGRPTHPGLLDWLAMEFVRGGWSLKRMHRMILLSSTYQQSCEVSSDALARDPGNLLFSRQNRIRLEGEVIRDRLLKVSGRLNLQLAGPSVFPSIPAELSQDSRTWNTSTELSDQCRRSVYVFARRNLRFPFFEVFDAPDSNLSCPQRGKSTTAPQALTLLNSEETLVSAQAISAQLTADNPMAGKEVQAERAYRSILGRLPSARERLMATEFLQSAPLSELCRALLNVNEFVYSE